MVKYESHRFGQQDSIFISEKTHHQYAIEHFHRNYELLFVHRGRMTVMLDGTAQPVGPGEYLLVFPNQIHAFQSQSGTHSKMVIFSPGYIAAFDKAFLNRLPQRKTFRAGALTERLVREGLVGTANEFTHKACLYALCGEILEQTRFYETSRNENTLLTHKTLEYIMENFTADVTLSALSRALGYNPQYLSRFINRRFSMSLPDLVNAYRVDMARYLLKNTVDTSASIAFQCGFKSIRNFNRCFVQTLGQTPGAFRRGE